MRATLPFAAACLLAASACQPTEPPNPSHATSVGADTRHGDGELTESLNGTLERVAPNQVVVRDEAGRQTSLVITSRVKVFDGRRQRSRRALLPEERVRISFSTIDGQRVAREVDILEVPPSLRREARRPLVK